KLPLVTPSRRARGSTATAATPCSAIRSSAAWAQSSALRRPLRSGLPRPWAGGVAPVLPAAAGGVAAGLAMSIAVHTPGSRIVSSPIRQRVDKPAGRFHTQPYGQFVTRRSHAWRHHRAGDKRDERRDSLPCGAAGRRVRRLPSTAARDLGGHQRRRAGGVLVPRRAPHRHPGGRGHRRRGRRAAAVAVPAQAAGHRAAAEVLPPLSQTGRMALETGSVGFEGELFTGDPDWDKLLGYPKPMLTEEEQAFLDGPVEELCRMVDEWEINHVRADLPPAVWNFIKQ